MTLDDVSCLMHLPIKCRFIDHSGPHYMSATIDVTVELLGSDVVEVDY